MPFTFAANWKACKGSSKCPCPNHLSPASHIELPSPSTTPDLHSAIYSNEHTTPANRDIVLSTIPDLESQLRKAEYRSRMLSRLRRALVLETEKVDNELQRLQNHQDVLSLAISNRKSIDAPMRTLPTEILTHIFSLTVDDDFPVQRRKNYRGSRGWPIQWSLQPQGHELDTFQLVCQRWRRAIIGCPSLWSRILIVAHPALAQKHRIARQIERTGQNKLNVCITIAGDGEYPLSRNLPPDVLSLLKPVTARIQSLHISLPLAMLKDLVPLHNSLPSLEALHVHNLNPGYGFAHPLNVIGSAPNLTAYYAVDMWVAPDFPWHQITHYSTDNGTSSGGKLETALKVLQKARRLQTCSLHITKLGSLPEQIADQPLICGKLSSLELKVTRPAGQPLRPIFLHCRFPALQKLVVYTGTCSVPPAKRIPDEPETFRDMLRCLQRSKSPIVHLKFHFSRIDPQDAIELFQTVTSLETIQLTGIESGINDDVLQALTVDSDTIPAPALRNLYLQGDLTFTPSVMASMLGSRWLSEPAERFWVSIGWSDMKFHAEHRQGHYVYNDFGDEVSLLRQQAQKWREDGRDLCEELQSCIPRGCLHTYVDDRIEMLDTRVDISKDMWSWRHL